MNTTTPQGPPITLPTRPPRSLGPLIWLAGIVAFLAALLAIRSYLSRMATNREVKRMIAAGESANAADVLERQIEASPNDAHLYVLLGKVFLSSGDAIRAQEAFDKAVSLDSGQAATVAQLYFARGQSAFGSSNAADARQFLMMATRFDPSLGPKIAEQFYDRGKAAFQLRDMGAAEQLFAAAIQFDPAMKSKAADAFAEAANTDLDYGDLNGAERYARDAVAYDSQASQRYGQAVFERLKQSLCNLHALGKQRFDAMMKLSSEFGLPDPVKSGISYRFAFGLQLYENGSRQQGLDILREVAHELPGSCEGVEANYILSPPPPGRIMVTATNPVTVGALALQLLYVDIFADAMKLTFSIKNTGDDKTGLVYMKPGRRTDPSELVYILDGNGTKLNTTTGWVGGRQSTGMNFGGVRLAGGEQSEIHADFPLPTPGSNTFKLVSPEVSVLSGFLQGGAWQAWAWPETKIKRDLFE